MRALSKEKAEEWCERHGILLDARRVPQTPAMAESFEIPRDSGARVALVGRHMESYRGEAETLVWFTEWGVWPSGERPHVFTRFVASYGEHRPLIEVPAFTFEHEEYEDAVSFVTIGVLFLWDVFVAARETGRLLHYSHDEVGWVA